MVDGQVTIYIGKYWHLAIGGTLAANALAFLRLFWWLHRHYRRYRDDFITFVEEHNALVEEHNRKNPNNKINFAYTRYDRSRIRQNPTPHRHIPKSAKPTE
jgi:hypothetical protein